MKNTRSPNSVTAKIQEQAACCLLLDAMESLDKARQQLEGGNPQCAAVIVFQASKLFDLALKACEGVAVDPKTTAAMRFVSLDVSRLSTGALVATQRLKEKTKHP